jgi:septal ring factor EnvC (AmiA/AmiB activator)
MARRLSASLVLIAAGLAMAAAGPAPPALRQLEANERDRDRDRQAALAEAQAARLEIAQLQAQLDALNAAQKNGEKNVSDKKLRLAALSVREAQLDGEIGANRAKLARLLSALELLRRDPPPALFVNPGDVRDAVRAAILMKAITPQLEQRAQALKAQAENLRKVKRAVDTASEDLFTSESDVADRKAKIEALIAARSALEGQDTAAADVARQDVDALSARATVLRELSQGLAVAAPAAPIRDPPDPEHAGLFGRPKMFTAPAPGAPIQRFGVPEPGGGRSLGWTWRTADNAAVVAPAQGVVEYAGPLKGWSVVAILRLGGGFHIVLAGLDQVTVGPGQMVGQGQAIGRMGKREQGPPELYLEIRRGGATIDPARWLKAPTAKS